MFTYLFDGETSCERRSNYNKDLRQPKYIDSYSIYSSLKTKTLITYGHVMNEGQLLTNQNPNYLWSRYEYSKVGD